MDKNEISFEALFSCCEFIHYSSPQCKKVYKDFDLLLEEKISDKDIRHDIDSESGRCCNAAYESGFAQGFCFAVKIMDFLNDISNHN